jgi:hypothetical protein
VLKSEKGATLELDEDEEEEDVEADLGRRKRGRESKKAKKERTGKAKKDRRKIQKALSSFLEQCRQFQYRDAGGIEVFPFRYDNLLAPPPQFLVRPLAAPGSPDRESLKQSLLMDSARVSKPSRIALVL